MSRRRPQRGGGGSTDRTDRNILVAGGEGEYHPQGGAEPGATEAGDLEAREFGVPQADLPGGVKHIVNPQQPPSATIAKPERPADYHKYHGVPSDDGGYNLPEYDIDGFPRAAPEPQVPDAVPVYIVAGHESGGLPLAIVTASRILIAAAGTAGTTPTRVCDRDLKRKGVRLLNEDASAKIRIHEDEGELVAPSGTNGGAIVPPGATSYLPLETQDALYAITDGSSAAYLSVICETEREGAGR